MKFTTVFFALAAIVAGTATTEAAPADHAGPWSRIHHKNEITHFRIYTEPRHANLRLTKPVMDKCVIYMPRNKEREYSYFEKQTFLEFQRLGPHTVGINCPNCLPTELGNFYTTKLGAAIECAIGDHRSADWKPKGGN